MDKKKFVLDCDPGSDDAIAIMLALYSEKVQLLGITTVNGNRIVPKTTENALRLVEFFKRRCTSVPWLRKPYYLQQRAGAQA